MRSSTALIDGLNHALTDELTAIGQYMVQSAMTERWGYTALRDMIDARAHDEMRHAQMLIDRILFLGGMPSFTGLGPVHIGETVPEQIANDLADEQGAFETYNKLIQVAEAESDKGTEEMLSSILRDEERHVRTLESQTAQIKHMGLETFLGIQAA